MPIFKKKKDDKDDNHSKKKERSSSFSTAAITDRNDVKEQPQEQMPEMEELNSDFRKVLVTNNVARSIILKIGRTRYSH
jgi:hypothetical protein